MADFAPFFQYPHPKQQGVRGIGKQKFACYTAISLTPMFSPTSPKRGLAGDPGCQSSEDAVPAEFEARIERYRARRVVVEGNAHGR